MRLLTTIRTENKIQANNQQSKFRNNSREQYPNREENEIIQTMKHIQLIPDSRPESPIEIQSEEMMSWCFQFHITMGPQEGGRFALQRRVIYHSHHLQQQDLRRKNKPCNQRHNCTAHTPNTNKIESQPNTSLQIIRPKLKLYRNHSKRIIKIE